MKKGKLNISEEPHNKDLESIGSIIMPMIKGVISQEDLVATDIMLNWYKVVGEDIASFSRPINVKYNPKDNKRTVFVEVPVGGFALEMQHRENYILEKINSYFGYKAIHALNITQNITMQIRVFDYEKNDKKKKHELTKEEQDYLLNIANGINDEKLKEILIKLGESVIQSKCGENEC